MRGSWRRVAVGAVMAAPLLWCAGAAAQTPSTVRHAAPTSPPAASEAVTRVLSAEFLSEAEKKDLRIFHGQWTGADVDTPARMARAALVTGSLDDPSLQSADADVLDRAEAALLRGET